MLRTTDLSTLHGIATPPKHSANVRARRMSKHIVRADSVKSMPRLVHSAFVSVMVVLFLLPAGLGCDKSRAVPTADPPSTSVEVHTVDVRQEAMPTTMLLTGTLRGELEADLAANASGRVLETYVERGSEVPEGAVLVKLDVRAATLGAAEASANARVAQVQANTSWRECKRYAQLLKSGAIAKAEYDRVADQCRSMPLSLAAAEARARSAEQVVNDGLVRAPFSGIVTERHVNIGEFVRQDSRVVTLVKIDELRLEFPIPEANLRTVKEGASITFSVPAYPDQKLSGKVRTISATVRAVTRDVVAEATVGNSDRMLRPGMFATIELVTGETMVPVVPKSTLVARQERTHLFVLNDGRVEERVVQTGQTSGDLVAIVQGLRAGERVVDHPSETLRNGQAAR
jgi:membrane fusion protein, multidrug efflux system